MSYPAQAVIIMGVKAEENLSMRLFLALASLLLLINPVGAQKSPTNPQDDLRFLIDAPPIHGQRSLRRSWSDEGVTL